MSGGRFKTKEKKATKLYEACEHCGKPKRDDLGGTVTRWVFRLSACECKPNAACSSYALSASETTEQAKEKVTNTNGNGNQASIDLGERYEIIEMIGQGGMGTVYRVRDKVLEKEFAIKLLREDFATDPSAIKRFEQEADAASDLTHPNMLATYGRGSTAAGAHFIVMDLLEGESLSQLLKRETKLDAGRVIDISTQICDALAHAHMKGLIHRDLKPSNIMLTENSEVSQTVKVLDFGIAKLKATNNRETQNLTETGDLFGSPSYMSPEQCLGFAVDARSDIYSLGCMMYEMLCGQPPFSGKNPIQTVVQHLNDEPPPLKKLVPGNKVNARLQSIIMRCLEKNSDLRYQSMDEVKADLQLVAAGKLPKQAKKLALKQVPLSWPVISTIVLIASWWLGIELATLAGFITSKSMVWFAVAGYSLSLVCGALWCTVLGQACWKKINSLRSAKSTLDAKWLTAAVIFLTICVYPAFAWYCGVISYTAIWNLMHFKSWGAFDQFIKPLSFCIMVVSNASIFLAFLAALGWALIRGAMALNFSVPKQRLIALGYTGCLILSLVLGYKNLAWIPYAANDQFAAETKVNDHSGLDLAIAINPEFARALFDRGTRLSNVNDPGAISDFSKVIELNSDKELSRRAYSARSGLYALEGNFAKAISDLRKTIDLASQSSYSNRENEMLLAFYLRQLRQDNEAFQIYTGLIAKDRGYSQAYQQRSELYLQDGDLKNALADIDTAILWDQNEVSYFGQRARIYEKLGQVLLAKQDYETTARRFHQNKYEGKELRFEDYTSAADAERKLGNLDQAKEYSQSITGMHFNAVKNAQRKWQYLY